MSRIPEKSLQQQIVTTLRALGFRVWVTGSRRPRGDYQGTCITAGLPDVIAFGRGHLLFIEVKAAGGRLRPEQAAFRDECAAVGIPHVVGGVDELYHWLLAQGIVRADQVAHYRLPREVR